MAVPNTEKLLEQFLNKLISVGMEADYERSHGRNMGDIKSAQSVLNDYRILVDEINIELKVLEDSANLKYGL